MATLVHKGYRAFKGKKENGVKEESKGFKVHQARRVFRGLLEAVVSLDRMAPLE